MGRIIEAPELRTITIPVQQEEAPDVTADSLFKRQEGELHRDFEARTTGYRGIIRERGLSGLYDMLSEREERLANPKPLDTTPQIPLYTGLTPEKRTEAHIANFNAWLEKKGKNNE